ncbi:MAG TPA: hypothetical protein VMZ66_05320 [Aeromicrobium sp.]|nr:hypothetical protein [Aeromicrobium sp.]
MTTGIMTAVAGFPDTSDDTNSDLAYLRDIVAWEQISTTPASGLRPARQSRQLHMRTLTGAKVADVVVESGEGVGNSYSNTAILEQDDVVVIETSTGRMGYSSTGQALWRTKDIGLAQTVTASLYEVSGRTYSARSGHRFTTDDLNQNHDLSASVCGDRAFLSSPGDSYLVVDTAREPRVTKLNYDPQRGGTYNELTPFGKVETANDPSVLRLVDFAGKTVWSIRGDVVSDHDTVGKWVLITNPSDDKVLVDARTGKDVTATRSDLIRAISMTSSFDATAHSIAGDSDHVILTGRDHAFRLKRTDVCG